MANTTSGAARDVIVDLADAAVIAVAATVAESTEVAAAATSIASAAATVIGDRPGHCNDRSAERAAGGDRGRQRRCWCCSYDRRAECR
jgi:hypothetical protein